jgi:hypothetical protein
VLHCINYFFFIRIYDFYIFLHAWLAINETSFVYNIVEFPLSRGGFSPSPLEFYRRFVVEIPPLFEGTCDVSKIPSAEVDFQKFRGGGKSPLDWRKFHHHERDFGLTIIFHM